MITITLTEKQYQIFQALWEQAKANDLKLSDWLGETADEVEARYQLPHDEILDDMADAFWAQRTGTQMF